MIVTNCDATCLGHRLPQGRSIGGARLGDWSRACGPQRARCLEPASVRSRCGPYPGPGRQGVSFPFPCSCECFHSFCFAGITFFKGRLFDHLFAAA